jgi:glycosyltransferase involved in cell wall biosynthesis
MQSSVDKPEISVVMTAYNAEKYIENTIQSILCQDFTDFEFIIIDDGSTDSTADIIRKFASNDNRIKAIIEGKKGYYNARRELINVSIGKYIAVIDADDIALATRLRQQYNFLEEHLDYGFCGGDCICIDSEDNMHRTQFNYPHSNDAIKASLLFYNCNVHPAAFIRRSVLEENNLNYIDCAAEDWQLWLQLSRFTKLSNISTPIIKYRIHARNMNQSEEIKSRYRREVNNFLWKNYLEIFSCQELELDKKLYAGYFSLVYWDADFENYEAIKYFVHKTLSLNDINKYVDKQVFIYILFERIQKKFIRFNLPDKLHYQHYKDIVSLLKNYGIIHNDYLRDIIIYLTAKTKKRWLK